MVLGTQGRFLTAPHFSSIRVDVFSSILSHLPAEYGGTLASIRGPRPPISIHIDIKSEKNVPSVLLDLQRKREKHENGAFLTHRNRVFCDSYIVFEGFHLSGEIRKMWCQRAFRKL